MEPSTLTNYESRLEPAALPAASVRVTLGALCTYANASMTWTVSDGRIIIHRRPAEGFGETRLDPEFLDRRLAFLDA